MKVLVCLVVLLVSAYAAPSSLESESNIENLLKDPKIFESQVREKIEIIRQLLREGNETLGIPCIEPLFIPRLPFNLKNHIATLKGELTNTTIKGLTYFNVSSLKINPLPIKVTVGFEWDLITAFGSYWTDSVLDNLIPVFGDGPYNVTITGFSFKAVAPISTGLSGVSVKSIDLTLDLDTITFHLENLIGGDLGDVVQEILNDNIRGILRLLKPTIETDVALIAKTFINKLLDGMSLDDIIGIINS